MTAAEIVAEGRKRGVTLEPTERGTVRLRGPVAEINALSPLVTGAKAALLVELRKREALIVAQRLLRLGRWPPVTNVCEFQVGTPGAKCRRCGASWLEHFPSVGEAAS
jgi:hypothetical protein